MKKPNFFILGAPKCGTTSLAAWLSEHPNVYFCPRKEPHHFNTDHHAQTRSRKHYERFFDAAGEQHSAVGEGSVFYLYSKEAVPNILEYAPDAIFIVCLRNPVEMALSLHDQQVLAGNEHMTDFIRAWAAQNRRKRGEAVTSFCVEPRYLVYGDVCSLGFQLNRLYRWVDRSRVLPVLLDDMARDPGREYRRVRSFLTVPDDGRTSFPVHNQAAERRSKWARRAMQLVSRIRQSLNVPRLGTGIMSLIDELNTRERPRTPPSPEVRSELQEFFAEDVRLLERLLDRDLNHWLE